MQFQPKTRPVLRRTRGGIDVTLRYSEANQHDALYLIARKYPGGVEALAHRLGKSSDVLYNKLRPGVLSHHTAFEEVSLILELAEEAGVADWALPLRAFCWRHRHIAIPLPACSETDDEQLTMLLCRTMKEIGDVADEISQATHDGHITERELERIEIQFTEATAALMALRERVRAKKDEAKERGDK